MYNFATNRMSGVHSSAFSLALKITSPDFGKTPHKGMERPSEAEFGVIVDGLAKELAEARYNHNHSKYEQLSSMADKVRAQYISAVSPDRKKMAQEASQLMKRSNSNLHKKTTDEPPNLIDFLNMKEGLGEYASEGCRSISSSSGTTVVFTGSDLQPDTFEIKGSKLGQTVMGYASGNWYYVNTPEEQKMQQAFLSRLNTAEERYYRQYLNSQSSNNGQVETSATSMQLKNKIDFLI